MNARRLAALVMPVPLAVFLPFVSFAAFESYVLPVETLKAIGGLPADIVNQFFEPVGFAEATTGEFVVLDRRNHTLYGVNAKKTTVRTILQVGFEEGRVLRPAALAVSPDDIIAVADAPKGHERIQFFSLAGSFLGGFYLPSRVAPRLVVGPLVLNGVGSMTFTGRTFLISQPENGALFSEIDGQGAVLRHFGTLRPTGHESDRDLHLALNIGIPLVDPQGSFYFVFQTGRPMIRKYDANGVLIYERHVEGVELDEHIRGLPTTWPRRTTEAGSLPLVTPLVRTAAVDPTGRLWVSLITPFTFVYDINGEKTRTVQFHGAAPLAASSLFFASRGRVLVTPGCYEFSVK
jgi:hypothetical protein